MPLIIGSWLVFLLKGPQSINFMLEDIPRICNEGVVLHYD